MKTQQFFRVMTAIALMLAITFSAVAQGAGRTRQVLQQTKETPQVQHPKQVQPLQKPDALQQFNKELEKKYREKLRLAGLDTLRVAAFDQMRIIKIDTSHIKNMIPFSGKGTSANPYKIKNAADLKRLADLVNSGTAPYANADTYYEQTANISLSGVTHKPIGSFTCPFYGKYSGAGFTISNLNSQDNSMPTGLFGCVNQGAVLANIRMTNVYISNGNDFVGGLAGMNAGEITYCCISESRIHGRAILGGIAGYNTGKIMNCIVRTPGKVGGFGYVGGIAGSNEGGTIENCYSEAWVEVKYGRVGGIVGDNTTKIGQVKFCYHTGPGRVHASGSTADFTDNQSGCGGIAGYGYVSYCVALSSTVGVVVKDTAVGRVCGILYGNDNYARSDMALTNGNGNVTPTIGTGAKDGGNITANDYYSSNWWKSIGFNPTHWLLVDGRLPHLKGFPGLTQNPTVTP